MSRGLQAKVCKKEPDRHSLQKLYGDKLLLMLMKRTKDLMRKRHIKKVLIDLLIFKDTTPLLVTVWQKIA